MYDFLIHSISDGKLPTSFLLNVTEKRLNIWSIWSWVCPTRRKPTFTFWKILNSTNMFRYPKTTWFLFSRQVLSNYRYKTSGRLPDQWEITSWIMVMVRFASLWIFGAVKYTLGNIFPLKTIQPTKWNWIKFSSCRFLGVRTKCGKSVFFWSIPSIIKHKYLFGLS